MGNTAIKVVNCVDNFGGDNSDLSVNVYNCDDTFWYDTRADFEKVEKPKPSRPLICDCKGESKNYCQVRVRKTDGPDNGIPGDWYTERVFDKTFLVVHGSGYDLKFDHYDPDDWNFECPDNSARRLDNSGNVGSSGKDMESPTHYNSSTALVKTWDDVEHDDGVGIMANLRGGVPDLN